MAINRLVSLLLFTPLAPFATALFTLAKLASSWMLAVVETVCALMYVTPVAGAIVLFAAPKILKAVAVELATPAAPHRGDPAKKAASSAAAVELPTFSKPTATLDTTPKGNIGTDNKPTPVELMPMVEPSTLKWAPGPGGVKWLKAPPPAKFTGGSMSAAAAAWVTAGEVEWAEGPGKGGMTKYFSGKAVKTQWPDGSKTTPNGQPGPKASEPMALNTRPKPAAAAPPAAAASKPPSAQAAAAPSELAPVPPVPKKVPAPAPAKAPAPPPVKPVVAPLVNLRETRKKNAVDETLELVSHSLFSSARFSSNLFMSKLSSRSSSTANTSTTSHRESFV